MKRKKTSRPFYNQDEAVSEIMGTLILITIAVSVLSAISLIILNPLINFSDENPPNVLFVAFIQNDNVIIEHRGGIPLDVQTKITITIAGISDTFNLNQFNYWNDENGDGAWSIGEQVVYPGGNLQAKEVSCTIIDVKKNSIIFDKIIQNGTSATSPYVTVYEPYDVSEISATLKMYYNFINVSNFASGHLNFTYGPLGGPYSSSPSVKPLTINGWYSLLLNGLHSGTQYECWAGMNYSAGNLSDGPMTFFMYQTTRGLWHFDEPAGSTIAHDVINPACDGMVNGATFGAVGKINGSLDFHGESDYVDVPHNPKFNITDQICIESWLNVSKTGAEFPGRIVEISTKNLSEIFSNTCFEPDLIQIAGTLYAVAYHDNTSAYVTTLRMTDDGVIQGVIDSKTVIVPHFVEPDIIQIHNHIYAVIYGAIDSQTEAKSHIVTMTIYENGTISNAIDSFDFPQYYGRESNIINIGSDIYAISFGGTSSQVLPTGYLVTIRIDVQGNIGHSIIDKLKFADTYCSETSLVHIANETYAIAYNGYGPTAGSGYIITVNILNNGSIIEPLVDTYQFGLPAGLEPTMIPVANDVYAIAYGADSNNQLRSGFLQTVRISPQGDIVNTTIDTLLLPIDYSFEIDFLHVDNEIYALAFSGGNNSNCERGFLSTVAITTTGNISNSVLSVYEFKNRLAFGCSAINLFSQLDRLIIFYGSTSSNEVGFLTMEKIDLTGTPKWIIHKGDAFGIMVNYDLIIASMTIGNTTYSVTGTVPLDSWTKVDLTYGSGFLKLYINDIIQTGGSIACVGEIKKNTDYLVFGGGLYGSIDEIRIFRSAYVPT